MTVTTGAPVAALDPFPVYRAGILKCDTPKCAASERVEPGWPIGWRKDFLGRLRCPDCTARCEQVPEGSGEDVLDGPRWAACLPVRQREIPRRALYAGNYDDLFTGLDERLAWMGGDGEDAPAQDGGGVPAEPGPEVAPEPEVAHIEEAATVITDELDGDGETHMAAFLQEHGIQDGHTAAMDVIPGDEF